MSGDGSLSVVSSDATTTTSYIYDVTTYQLLTETTDGESVNYEYGLERIAAYTENTKTEYVYDVRGSVAQTVTNNIIGSYSYTPFGEQLGVAVSGFGYNAEYYDAATGMQYLRARYYEPEMMRFSQKDLVRGSVVVPISLNRYLYVQNNPVLYTDPSGMVAKAAIRSTAVQAGGSVKKTVATKTANTVKSAAKVTSSVASTVRKTATTSSKALNTIANVATNIVSTSNSKIVKSAEKGVKKITNEITQSSNKATTIAKQVEKISSQFVNTNSKITKSSLSNAKNNFTSAVKPPNMARNNEKYKKSCGLSNQNMNRNINGEIIEPPKQIYESENFDIEKLLNDAGDYNNDGIINSEDIVLYANDKILYGEIYVDSISIIAGVLISLLTGGVGGILYGAVISLTLVQIGASGINEKELEYDNIIDEMITQEEVHDSLDTFYDRYKNLDPNGKYYEYDVHALIVEIEVWMEHNIANANSEQSSYIENLLHELNDIQNSFDSNPQ